MKQFRIIPLLVVLFLPGCKERQDNNNDLPNILWITCEDMSPRLACYGDSTVETPNISRLAGEGLRFTHAFSISAVCSPSRSALITGCYPTTIGTLHHRTTTDNNPACDPYVAVPPADVKGFPELLRKAGYYCTNNAKTDYQFGLPFTIWDESGDKAHWRNRPEEKPFFAVFNSDRTHEGWVFRQETWEKILADAQQGIKPGYYQYARSMINIDREKFNDPLEVPIPPYYPDHIEVRTDVARQYDNIMKMDEWVGELLQQLEEDGLADNTIVFFYADHGTCLPRGKRWMYDSGIRVPLIIRWPGHIEAGTITGQLVSFVDFAPTVLSLVGLDKPDYIQGRAFLGINKEEPRDYIFAARDRCDEGFDMIRAVRDKQYKYIRNYHPEIPYTQLLWYTDHNTAMQVMRELSLAGELKGAEKLWWAPVKPGEELYNVLNDPHEINNLAEDEKYREVLIKMRGVLDSWREETGDMGGIPEQEIRDRMWPGGNQPVTAKPEYRLDQHEHALVTLSCNTRGASIGYKTGRKGTWKIYSSPVPLEKNDTIYAKAIRYGFKESDLIAVIPER
jgi:N-sulfoglucosamine sulfohydrolase